MGSGGTMTVVVVTLVVVAVEVALDIAVEVVVVVAVTVWLCRPLSRFRRCCEPANSPTKTLM